MKISADREQPTGCPIILEMTLTNVGKESIVWRARGPAVYPQAEHFITQVRYGVKPDWHEVLPTNGQESQGSGGSASLKTGESITIPLAILVEKSDAISIRIRPLRWRAAYVEIYILVRNDPEHFERRRSRVIKGALGKESPFLRHVAAYYADSFVIDAMLKAIVETDETRVAQAAFVLAQQKTLPENAGNNFAVAVRHWFSQASRPDWLHLTNLARAALTTRSDLAWEAVIAAMQTAPDSYTRDIAIKALEWGPNDPQCLRRARAAILDLQLAAPSDTGLASRTKSAISFLDDRLAGKATISTTIR